MVYYYCLVRRLLIYDFDQLCMKYIGIFIHHVPYLQTYDLHFTNIVDNFTFIVLFINLAHEFNLRMPLSNNPDPKPRYIKGVSPICVSHLVQRLSYDLFD